MQDLNLPVTALTAVFLTHFHSDHMADIGEVISRSWILGRTSTLPIYGAAGVERIVDGFNLVYRADEAYRRAHHGETVFPDDATLPAEARLVQATSAEGTVVYDVGGVVVRAYSVDHSPVAPALGYRVEYRGRAVGISGDTEQSAGLLALAQDVDVLVSEVMDKGFALDTACALERLGDARNVKIFRDVRTYHIGLEDLAATSAEAGVGQLLLTHMVPSVPSEQAANVFVAPIAAIYDGAIIAAEDGTRVVLEVNASE